MSETPKTSKAAAEKSAADLLIELQLEEKRKQAINPLAVVSDEEQDGSQKIDSGASVVRVVKFADGTVAEHYA